MSVWTTVRSRRDRDATRVTIHISPFAFGAQGRGRGGRTPRAAVSSPVTRETTVRGRHMPGRACHMRLARRPGPRGGWDQVTRSRSRRAAAAPPAGAAAARALGPPTADPRRCGARPPARRPPVARSRDWHAESWVWHAAARTWHRLLAAMPFDFLREFLARESMLKIAVAAARSGGPWLPGYRHLGVHCVGRSLEVAPVEGL